MRRAGGGGPWLGRGLAWRLAGGGGCGTWGVGGLGLAGGGGEPGLGGGVGELGGEVDLRRPRVNGKPQERWSVKTAREVECEDPASGVASHDPDACGVTPCGLGGRVTSHVRWHDMTPRVGWQERGEKETPRVGWLVTTPRVGVNSDLACEVA